MDSGVSHDALWVHPQYHRAPSDAFKPMPFYRPLALS